MLAPRANCKGNVSSINANIIIVFLGYTRQKRSQWITLFEIASQRSTSQAYWVTLALISNIANYLQCNYFWDCDGIDNVTLRLWKVSNFCSRHTVGVAGDDIMFHILFLYMALRQIYCYGRYCVRRSVSPQVPENPSGPLVDNFIVLPCVAFGVACVKLLPGVDCWNSLDDPRVIGPCHCEVWGSSRHQADSDWFLRHSSWDTS